VNVSQEEPTTDRRRREIARLKREITYFCGIVARTASREQILRAHAAIRQRERQLSEALSAWAAAVGPVDRARCEGRRR